MSKFKRKLIAAGVLLLLCIISLSVATYTWMSIATSVRVNDLELSVISENAMEIALDQNGQPGEWTCALSLNDAVDGEVILRPITWSAEDRTFYAPKYGSDGRIDYLDPLPIKTLGNGTLPPSADEAEEGEGEGYLLVVDLWLRTGASQAQVFLSEPAVGSEGKVGTGTYVVGAPVWDADSVSHQNGGNGAERAVRIGFQTYDESYEKGTFIIYEPNAPADREQTLTPDGKPLQGEGTLIRQELSSWTENSPAIRDTVGYQMGRFTTDTALFTLISDTPRRITLYLWLEGQDPQCSNSVSAGQLIANFQFGAKLGGDRVDTVQPQ